MIASLHKSKFDCFTQVVATAILLSVPATASAQLKRKVLFLGNSYTYVNNLPKLFADAALSAGDTLVYDSHAVGAYQLESHSQDATSKAKIMAGGWHYVVLQGQSQEPVILQNQFMNGGSALYSQIRQYNPCAVPMGYITWGRKNGDAANCPSFPVMCTYKGMDTTLRNRYVTLMKQLQGEAAPVSVVWSYLRQQHPGIELYDADESHPSPAGSYAAACCFYTSIFKKDPTLITFSGGLSAADAAIIRNAAKTQVFNNLSAWDFKRKPVSSFSYQIGAGVNQVIFSPASQGVKQTYLWDFGDGSTSVVTNPSHSYAGNGTYTVSLTTTNCDLQGVHTSFTDTVINFCAHSPSVVTTQTWLCNYDTLWTQPADAWQWVYNGKLLPETKQYLADYARYGLSGFSVLSTINGCQELSPLYTEAAAWTGYYFDAAGDPCKKTVPFAILHSNGFLSGTEHIYWYKNGSLLNAMTGEDTLLVSASGKYECIVVNPASDCPYDTTSYLLSVDCGDLIDGFHEFDRTAGWQLFPNPATETVTLSNYRAFHPARIEIVNSIGVTVRIILPEGDNTFSVGDLPAGLYFVRANGIVMKLVKE